MEKRLNSGQIYVTSHSSMMLNGRNPSTVQDGRKATTQISSLHLEASKYSSSPFDDSTIEAGNTLIDKMTEEKRKRWEEVITSNNMTHNSHKVWNTMRKLSNDPTTSNHSCLVSANQVAHQLLVNGRGTMPSKPKCPV